MSRVKVDANTKGAIGETVVLGGSSLPQPVFDDLFAFLSDLFPMGENPNPKAVIRRNVYFNATTEEGEAISWKADGRLTFKWSSPEMQNANPDHHQRRDVEAVIPVDVKTGKYAELERHQLNVARAIAKTPNNVFPAVIGVSIEELPEAFDVVTRIFGPDFT